MTLDTTDPNSKGSDCVLARLTFFPEVKPSELLGGKVQLGGQAPLVLLLVATPLDPPAEFAQRCVCVPLVVTGILLNCFLLQ